MTFHQAGPDLPDKCVQAYVQPLHPGPRYKGIATRHPNGMWWFSFAEGFTSGYYSEGHITLFDGDYETAPDVLGQDFETIKSIREAYGKPRERVF